MMKNKQCGIALLMVVIVLALAVSGYYFSKISVIDIKLDSKLRTQFELKRAKQALLDYALIKWRAGSETGQLGKLPCPDYTSNNNEGSQDTGCGNAYADAIGFFPWRTLGIDVPKDSSGSCFLYVVSPAYKSSPIAALNPDSYGQIQIVDSSGAVVQGATPEDRPIAVIIAPGKVLSAQLRVFDNDSICGNDYDNVASYLDDDGTNDNTAIDPSVDNVIDLLVGSYAGSEEGDNPDPLNDRLITITHQEFWGAMGSTITDTAFDEQMEILTEAIAHCLAAYGSNNSRYLPVPALMNLAGGEYRKSSDYNDSGIFTEGYSGRLPYNISKANEEVSATTNNNILFKNSYCDGLNIMSTSDPVWFTDPDPLSDILEGKYYQLWSNWKDHFFYAISKSHNPDAVAPTNNCSGDCLEVSGTKYAGIVFFAGLKDGQQRYTRPFDGGSANKTVDIDNVDDKDDIGNYLENNNADDFPSYSGDPLVVIQPVNDGFRDFSPDSNPTNDIRFCITPAMTVNQC